MARTKEEEQNDSARGYAFICRDKGMGGGAHTWGMFLLSDGVFADLICLWGS